MHIPHVPAVLRRSSFATETRPLGLILKDRGYYFIFAVASLICFQPSYALMSFQPFCLNFSLILRCAPSFFAFSFMVPVGFIPFSGHPGPRLAVAFCDIVTSPNRRLTRYYRCSWGKASEVFRLRGATRSHLVASIFSSQASGTRGVQSRVAVSASGTLPRICSKIIVQLLLVSSLTFHSTFRFKHIVAGSVRGRHISEFFSRLAPFIFLCRAFGHIAFFDRHAAG